MLTILNKKELMITMDMKRQAEIRNILSQNNIEYSVKTTNLLNAELKGSGRVQQVGSLGINLDHSYEYKIYVNKKDYDRALYLIGK